MKLNYLITGLSFVLLQYVTSATPMGNEEVTLQNTQVYKRDNGIHLEKRKKKNRLFGKHGRFDKHPLYYSQAHREHQNPRFFEPQPAINYGQPYGTPFSSTDPYRSSVMPIGSVNSDPNPIMDPTTMNGSPTAGNIPDAGTVADPTTANNLFNGGNSGVPNSNTGVATPADANGNWM